MTVAAPLQNFHPSRRDPRVVRLPDPQPDRVAEQDEQDLLIFAGGAIELRVPVGWQVRELPRGREVHLQFECGGQRAGGIVFWLTYHVASAAAAATVDERLEFVRGRLAAETDGEARLGQSEIARHNGHPLIRQPFQYETRDERQQQVVLRGQHVVVETSWGLCELHYRRADATARSREIDGVFEQTLASLRLSEPQWPREPIVEQVSDAAEILGSWKAYRSRLQLRPDGRVVIVHDPVHSLPLDAGPQPAQQPATLTGHFVARDDLLLVTWDDGSLLNFRWRLQGSDLLLTDHEGQISQLRRLFE